MMSAASSSAAAQVSVAIVGGGLAGVYAAWLLHAVGIDFHILEARDRLGGRILSAGANGKCSSDGFDLGPSWFWPEMHSDVAAIVGKLGLPTFPQYDDGDVLVERQPNGRAQRYSGYRQEPRSMRLAGGTGTLVQTLARDLPPASIRLGA